MYKLAVLAVSLTLAVPALAADPKFDPEARAQAVAPYLDEETIAVGHVDLTRVDVDALAAKAVALTRQDAKELLAAQRVARQWLANFTKAGGKDLYGVVSIADLPFGQPYLVVPLPAGADTDALNRLLLPVALLFHKGEVEKIGSSLVVGGKETLERLRPLKPMSRPELVKAFAAGGDTAAQALLLPTADSRRVLEEAIPTLPKEVGGGSVTAFTRGLLWAAVGVDPSPKLAVHLVIQSQDAAAAHAFADLFARGMKRLAEEKEVQESLPHFAQLVELLTPKVAGDRLTLALDDNQLVTALAPLVGKAQEAAGRQQSTNNLKQIGLAMHSHQDTYRSLPPVANLSKEGKPLLSWRVHLLPFVDESNLYKEFHLDEPWDSAHNKKLIARMPRVYRSSNKVAAQGKTTYLGPLGEKTMFPGGPKGLRLPADIPDGTANTIFVVDADDAHAVIWTKPDDLKYDPKDPKAGLGGQHYGGFLALFVDGSVRFLPTTIDADNLRALFTRNGGEVVTIP